MLYRRQTLWMIVATVHHILPRIAKVEIRQKRMYQELQQTFNTLKDQFLQKFYFISGENLIFLKHKCVLLRNISAVKRKKYLRESCHIPFYAWKFAMPDFFRNPEGFLYEKLRYWATKKIDGNSWSPHIFSINFSLPGIFSNTEWGTYKNSVHWETESFKRKVLFPPLLHKIEINDEIHVCRKPMKTGFKRAVWSFTVCKNLLKCLYLGKKYSPSRPSGLAILYRSCNEV